MQTDLFILICILSGETRNNESELMQTLIAIHHPGLRGQNGLFNYDFNYLPGLEPKCMITAAVVINSLLYIYGISCSCMF